MPRPSLNHLDALGRARMVDVARKPVTRRVAVAHATVRLDAATLRLIQAGRAAKGDVLAVARVAGIGAAKETSRLIPLCHPLPLTAVEVSFRVLPPASVEVEATARVEGRTGVEMEALTAAAIAALTIYDMVKGVCRGATITDLELLEKDGGQSGRWRRNGAARGPGRRRGRT